MKKVLIRSVLSLAFALVLVPSVSADSTEAPPKGASVVMSTGPDW
ncbi:hypothetical protein [Brevibacillus brevis]|nr:hypothetical protein [Lysinibacillus sp. SDF0063]